MSDWNFFKIDIWWKAVLVLGVLSVAGAVFLKIEFINNKHLFGFGIGSIMIGIGYWKSFKAVNDFAFGGIITTWRNQHDPISKLLISIGVLVSLIFLILVFKDLI